MTSPVTPMSENGIVRADGEFLQGNYKEAEELYANALDQLEAAYPDPEQNTQLAACLQKLGDTNYVLDKFTEAEQVFQRLLTLLQQTEGPVQDIVTTLLKLAKIQEKQDKLDEADHTYQQAAEMGERDARHRAFHFIQHFYQLLVHAGTHRAPSRVGSSH